MVQGIVIYENVINLLKIYFPEHQVKELFLEGGCFWLANFLHHRIENSFILFDKEKEHCGIEFQNNLYDITGKISRRGYFIASDEQLEYMKKNYRPNFDVTKLTKYLDAELMKRGIWFCN